ncbi:MAG: tyrosine-type recombinase/integrase [Rikenellaceae bacterium]
MSISEKITAGLQYLPPRLTEGTTWTLTYHAIYPPTGKLRRVRIKLNRFQKISERRAYAKRLSNEIIVKLVSGWNPFIEAEAPKAFYKLYAVMDTYMRIQEKEAETHSLRSYKSFIKYLKGNCKETMLLHQFDKAFATKLMLDLKQDPNISFRTYNNYLQFFTTFFNWMIQYNYVSVNPFATLKKAPKKLTQKRRIMLTTNNRHELISYLEKENKNNYLVMCLMCYYCFIRPNEISLLRVRDINIERQLIFISKEIAKNDTDSVRTMPDAMMQYVKKLDLSGSPDDFLFSMDVYREFVPGKKRAEGREIARFWCDVIRPALGWPMELQFYSLKDTGITNMLDDGIAPNFVQGQADHSSLSITSIYAAKRNDVSQEQIRKKAKCF